LRCTAKRPHEWTTVSRKNTVNAWQTCMPYLLSKRNCFCRVVTWFAFRPRRKRSPRYIHDAVSKQPRGGGSADDRCAHAPSAYRLRRSIASLRCDLPEDRLKIQSAVDAGADEGAAHWIWSDSLRSSAERRLRAGQGRPHGALYPRLCLRHCSGGQRARIRTLQRRHNSWAGGDRGAYWGASCVNGGLVVPS
jgi:hypothetical protein